MRNVGSYPNTRMRRNRKTDWSRRLVQESNLSTSDLIWPIFIRDGRNVMHGFVIRSVGSPKNGLPCLITNDHGDLVGHGIAQCGSKEMIAFRKGIAVKVRGGINLEGD